MNCLNSDNIMDKLEFENNLAEIWGGAILLD